MSIEIDARGAPKAERALKGVAQQAENAGRKTKIYSRQVKQASKESNRFTKVLMSARGAMTALSAGVAGITIGKFARQIEQATTQLNNINATMRVATGDATQAGQAIGFIREEADRLGLFFPAVAKQMAQFSAAARGTSITSGELRDIFTGISEASRAMGLTAPQAEGAMMALQQMMSKGKVSAEELRQQLGERMPGSIQIMAQALDVNTQKLFEMMENGELLSDEVLPKFGRELQRVFGSEAADQADRIAAAIGRLETAFFDLMAQDNLSGAAEAINELADTLSSEDFNKIFDDLVTVLSELSAILAKNLDHIVKFTVALGAFGAARFATKLLSGLTGRMNTFFGILAPTTAGTVALTGALQAVQATLLRFAGPAGILIGATSLIKMYTGAVHDAAFASTDWKEANEELEESIKSVSSARLTGMLQEARAEAARVESLENQLAAAQERLEQLPETGDPRARGMAVSAVARLERELSQAKAAAKAVTDIQDQMEMSQVNAMARGQAEAGEEASIAAKKTREYRESLEELAEEMSQGTRKVDLLPPGTRDELAVANAELERVRNNLDILDRDKDDSKTDNAQDELDNITSSLNNIIGRFDPISAAGQKFASDMKTVQDALDAGVISTSKAQEITEKLEEEYDKATRGARGLEGALQDIAESMTDDVSNGLTDIIMQAESAKDVFIDLANQIARTITQQQIAAPLAQGITDFATSAIPSLFGGGTGSASAGGGAPPNVRGIGPDRANGGNVFGQTAHMVGERGPELFVPRQDGQIVPNHQMGGGGGDVTVNVINQGGEQLQAEQQQTRRGPNGEMTVDVMVKKSMERLDSQGQLDGIFRRHGARRQGQF